MAGNDDVERQQRRTGHGSGLGLLIVAILAAGAIMLSGCESPAAQREHARAERSLAEAQAYQQRVQADTVAAAERAAIRESERERGHQQAMEMLPYVLIIGGGLLVAGLVVLMMWDVRLHGRPGGMDPAVMAQQMEQLRLQHAATERAMYRLLIEMQRQKLSAGMREREVVVVEPRTW